MPYEWSTEPPHKSPEWELSLWPYRSLLRKDFVLFIGATAALVSLPMIAVLGTAILWGLLPFFGLMIFSTDLQLASFLDERLLQGGQYINLSLVLWDIVFIFQCANSTFNFFVYYRMGSRFRQTLMEMLSCFKSSPTSLESSK